MLHAGPYLANLFKIILPIHANLFKIILPIHSHCSPIMLLFHCRYDEWIKPEKIAGCGTRQTRNRTGGPGSAAKGQETNAKSPPKPVARPTAKPSGRRTNKASAGAGKEASAKQLPPANGTKSALKRPCSPSTRSGSLSPSLGKSPKSGSGRGTTRTRSERSSASEMSNGLEEGRDAFFVFAYFCSNSCISMSHRMVICFCTIIIIPP